MNTVKSEQLFSRARKLLPGGVNSPVRACAAVGCEPLFVSRAQGCEIIDVDGNAFIDMVSSWGPLILGHARPEVVDAIHKYSVLGTSFGAPSPLEVELANMVCQAMPAVEKVRFVNSGTEATMSAIRLARAYTGRNVVLKFDGCYHGHADSFLIKAGSGLITLGIPGSPGVPEDIVKNTISIPYNDKAALVKTLTEREKEIACVIVEPVAGNMGVVLPEPGFLETLRAETKARDIVLIFDEVITGFRLAYGGAQARFGIRPDLTCLGKIIGGGLPVAAYGGKRELMQMVAPEGPVYQAGTLSGNPLAMAAGIAMLSILCRPGFYEALEEASENFARELASVAESAGVPVCLNHLGSMMTCFFTGEKVRDYATAMSADTELYARFYRHMLEAGVWFGPSQFEAFFLSAAHEKRHLNQVLAAAAKAFQKLAQRSSPGSGAAT